MKVEIQISADIKEPYAIIHTNQMTEEIQQIFNLFHSSDNSSCNVITVTEQEHLIVLQPLEIYMLRMENECLIVYCQQKHYVSNKRLYEMETLLGNGFMRISKSTIINLKKIKCVGPSFHGTMLIVLKNGSNDYISRKYLLQLKNMSNIHTGNRYRLSYLFCSGNANRLYESGQYHI